MSDTTTVEVEVGVLAISIKVSHIYQISIQGVTIFKEYYIQL